MSKAAINRAIIKNSMEFAQHFADFIGERTVHIPGTSDKAEKVKDSIKALLPKEHHHLLETLEKEYVLYYCEEMDMRYKIGFLDGIMFHHHVARRHPGRA